MKMVKKNWMMLFCSTTLIYSSFVFSNDPLPIEPNQEPEVYQAIIIASSEEQSDENEDRQIPYAGAKPVADIEIEEIGTERLSPQDEMKFWENRSKAVATQENEQPEEQAPSTDEVIAKSYYYSGAYHNPWLHSIGGENITFNDGSKWAVHPFDRYTILRWNASDVVFIRPNSDDWFSSYRFLLCNQSSGDVVQANLIGASTFLQIMNIDFFNNLIVFSDGTVWMPKLSDSIIYASWKIGSRIIVGINNNFGYNYIIINAENLSYIESN